MIAANTSDPDVMLNRLVEIAASIERAEAKLWRLKTEQSELRARYAAMQPQPEVTT